MHYLHQRTIPVPGQLQYPGYTTGVNIGYSKLYAVSNLQGISTTLSVVVGLLYKVLSVGIDWTTWQAACAMCDKAWTPALWLNSSSDSVSTRGPRPALAEYVRILAI